MFEAPSGKNNDSVSQSKPATVLSTSYAVARPDLEALSTGFPQSSRTTGRPQALPRCLTSPGARRRKYSPRSNGARCAANFGLTWRWFQPSETSPSAKVVSLDRNYSPSGIQLALARPASDFGVLGQKGCDFRGRTESDDRRDSGTAGRRGGGPDSAAGQRAGGQSAGGNPRTTKRPKEPRVRSLQLRCKHQSRRFRPRGPFRQDLH
jgi:hypothetical protein